MTGLTFREHFSTPLHKVVNLDLYRERNDQKYKILTYIIEACVTRVYWNCFIEGNVHTFSAHEWMNNLKIEGN